MKQFEPSPLSTNPPISEQFFHDSPLCPNFKNQEPPLPLTLGVRKLCKLMFSSKEQPNLAITSDLRWCQIC